MSSAGLRSQFIPGYRENINAGRTQPELAIPGLVEEVKKKVNRPVPELPIADDNDVARHQSNSGNGNGNGHRGLTAHLHDHQPAGRAHLPELRPRGRPQRRLLQMPELRRKPRVQLEH